MTVREMGVIFSNIKIGPEVDPPSKTYGDALPWFVEKKSGREF